MMLGLNSGLIEPKRGERDPNLISGNDVMDPESDLIELESETGGMRTEVVAGSDFDRERRLVCSSWKYSNSVMEGGRCSTLERSQPISGELVLLSSLRPTFFLLLSAKAALNLAGSAANWGLEEALGFSGGLNLGLFPCRERDFDLKGEWLMSMGVASWSRPSPSSLVKRSSLVL